MAKDISFVFDKITIILGTSPVNS